MPTKEEYRKSLEDAINQTDKQFQELITNIIDILVKAMKEGESLNVVSNEEKKRKDSK